MEEFEKFRRLAYLKFGLKLGDEKKELVAARLAQKLREQHFHSFDDYYRNIEQDSTGAALIAMIDTLTTNHTSFWREFAHFEFLRAVVLPGLRGRDHIEIWCAASATGEEAYTLAFCLLEGRLTGSSPPGRILATDISTRALNAAAQAVYPAGRLSTLPGGWLQRYFVPVRKNTDDYKVCQPARAMVEFRRLNLIEPYVHPGPFQVIFCRNVMIYFDNPTRQAVVSRLIQFLEPGGYLFIGLAESLMDIQHPLRYVRASVYQKPGATGSGNTPHRRKR